MKSGKRITLIWKEKFDSKDYRDAHKNADCNGEFKFKTIQNDVISLGPLGLFNLPVAPYLVCEKCEAAFIAPGFVKGFEKFLAIKMVLSPHLLMKRQLRFLRVHLGLSQQEVADILGATDRQYIQKTESDKYERQLGPDKQVRLKIIYAEMLGIKDLQQIYQISKSIEDTPLKTDEVFKEALEQFTKEAAAL